MRKNWKGGRDALECGQGGGGRVPSCLGTVQSQHNNTQQQKCSVRVQGGGGLRSGRVQSNCEKLQKIAGEIAANCGQIAVL